MTYEKLLKHVSQKAVQHQKEVEAIKLLLLELSGLEPHAFYLALKQEVDKTFEKEFIQKADLYILKDVPVQHILGYSYFYGHQFLVSDAVLIPRLETEQLVEHILYYYDKYFENKILNAIDLGTGSGCIGLTLAKEEPKLHMTVTDISEEALAVTRQNGQRLNVDVKYIQSDWFSNVAGQFDIIVSNPPYIPDDEDVQDIVKKEPSVALYGGHTGTRFYHHILQHIKPFMEQKCLVAFEHGYQQKEEIRSFIELFLPEANIIQLKDMQGKDRFTFLGFGGVLNDE